MVGVMDMALGKEMDMGLVKVLDMALSKEMDMVWVKVLVELTN